MCSTTGIPPGEKGARKSLTHRYRKSTALRRTFEILATNFTRMIAYGYSVIP